MAVKQCNLCGRAASQPIEMAEPESKTGRNVICTICGLIYHDPAMSAREMARFYANDYARDYHDSEAMQEELAKARLNDLKQHTQLSSLSPALEIGCAAGEFLRGLKAEGLVVSGIEPSEELARRAELQDAVDIRTGVYDGVPEQPAAYGLICMFHVLEHVPDPSATLARIRRELRQDGRLYLVVPTIGDCQLSVVFKTIHPTTFVRETLLAMLAATGFNAEAVNEDGYNLSVLARPADGEVPASYPDPEKVLRRVEDYLSSRRQVIRGIVAVLGDLRAEKGVAIYGAGHNTLNMNEVFDLSRLDISAIYDADPEKQGKSLLGLPVRPSEALREFDGSHVIISSFAYQEEIVAQLDYLAARGVKLVTLYDKTS